MTVSCDATFPLWTISNCYHGYPLARRVAVAVRVVLIPTGRNQEVCSFTLYSSNSQLFLTWKFASLQEFLFFLPFCILIIFLMLQVFFHLLLFSSVTFCLLCSHLCFFLRSFLLFTCGFPHCLFSGPSGMLWMLQFSACSLCGFVCQFDLTSWFETFFNLTQTSTRSNIIKLIKAE